METGSDLGDRGFIRRVFESSVAGASNRHRDGALAVTGEAFVAQMGDWGGGDLNMHGRFDALGAPNLALSTPFSCSAMPTCPETTSHLLEKSSQRPWRSPLCEIGDFSKRKFSRKWDWRPMERVAVRFSML